MSNGTEDKVEKTPAEEEGFTNIIERFTSKIPIWLFLREKIRELEEELA